jgi:hypothetical protein
VLTEQRAALVLRADMFGEIDIEKHPAFADLGAGYLAGFRFH